VGKFFNVLAKAKKNEAIEQEISQSRAAEGREVMPGPSSTEPQDNQAVQNVEEGLESLGIQLKDWDERLVAVNASYSEVAENFRRVRTHILHPAEGPQPKSILVTSATPDEGKSFVVANLGIALAQGVEHHALLVDCDLRRPALAAMFGISNDRGVTNHLLEGTALEHLIVKTAMQKLSIMPSGRLPINPAEIIGSQKMVEMAREVVDRYNDRFVVIDSPPLLAASETAVLAKQVDAVIVVVKWGKAARQEVLQLVEAIDRQKIIGVVFNAFRMSEFESRVSGHYYSKYGYSKKGYYKKKAGQRK